MSPGRVERVDQVDRVVICSSHVNAAGLVVALRAVGFAGPVTCLSHAGRSALTARFPSLCETASISVSAPEALPDRLAERFSGERCVVLHTDERFLEAFQGDPRFSGPTGSARLPEIFDRLRFYRALEADDLAATPHTVESSADPWAVFGDAFRVRVWHTWRGMDRLPRGLNVTHGRDLEAWRQIAAERGLSADEWGYQALLSTRPRDNVSVCGWFDAGAHEMIVTRRRGVANGLGWWVERIPDPAGLVPITARVLAAFGFEGPFELEFVWDPKTHVFRVIELNPRFWMQHLLAQRLTDFALIRRALGWPARGGVDPGGPVHWLQTDVALRHPLTTARLWPRAILGYPATGALGALVKDRSRR